MTVTQSGRRQCKKKGMKMNRKIKLATTCLLLASMFMLPVSAKKPGLRYGANGKLENYVDAWSAEIVNGHWHVKVKDGDLEFRAYHRERNLDEIENSPIGSVDHFWLSLTNVGSFVIDEDTLTIECTIHVDKLWWNIDTGLPEWVEWEYSGVVITVNSESIYIDSPQLGDQDWDRVGPTLSLHY